MSEAQPVRILVVDDHPVVRDGLVAMLSRRPGLVVVGQAQSGEEAVEVFRRLVPDVTLMDLKLPGMSGVETIRRLREECAGARVIVLTSFDGDDDVYRAFEAGARTYLLKSAGADELAEAIRSAHAGGRLIPPAVAARLAEQVSASPLTARERDVLRLVAQGRSNRDIAALLGVTYGTVKGYLHIVFRKLGVADRVQAVTTALRSGLVRLDPTAEPKARSGVA